MAAANYESYNPRRNYGHSYPLVTCILKVEARIPGWQRNTRELLSSIRGINSYKMDPNGFLEVSGAVDPYLLLERIGKIGRHAEIISVRYGDRLYTPGHGGGYDYGAYDPYYGYIRHGGQCGDEFVGGRGYRPACHGRSYDGYWNHPARVSSHNHNRPFAGLAESMRATSSSLSSPRWFWH